MFYRFHFSGAHSNWISYSQWLLTILVSIAGTLVSIASVAVTLCIGKNKKIYNHRIVIFSDCQ